MELGIAVVENGETSATTGSNSHCEHAVFTESAPAESFEELKYVRQGLKQRQVQMVALVGTIGTGLFLGSGRSTRKVRSFRKPSGLLSHRICRLQRCLGRDSFQCFMVLGYMTLSHCANIVFG